MILYKNVLYFFQISKVILGTNQSSKPLKSSSGESSESDDEETSQKGDFADFQSFQKLIKKEGETSIDDVPVSIRSSISSVDNDSHQNLEDCFKNYIHFIGG